MLPCVNTYNNALSVKSAEKLVFVKMRCNILHAKDSMALFVNMGDEDLNSNIP